MDVNQDSITEYDRNYVMASDFIVNGHAVDERSVAIALRRLIFESYVRYCLPEFFPFWFPSLPIPWYFPTEGKYQGSNS